MASHVPGLDHFIRQYRQNVLETRPTHGRCAPPGLHGITRKLVYAQTAAPLLNEDATHYMVKPYHERVSRRLRGWMHYPIQGWSEMANQGLYHAAGIGHLHQRVHVDEHDMGAGHDKEPALVVHMQHGFHAVLGRAERRPARLAARGPQAAGDGHRGAEDRADGLRDEQPRPPRRQPPLAPGRQAARDRPLAELPVQGQAQARPAGCRDALRQARRLASQLPLLRPDDGPARGHAAHAGWRHGALGQRQARVARLRGVGPDLRLVGQR
jgi:hypothetical protein